MKILWTRPINLGFFLHQIQIHHSSFGHTSFKEKFGLYGFKILTQLQLNKVMGVCVPGVFTAHCKVKMTSQLIVCVQNLLQIFNVKPDFVTWFWEQQLYYSWIPEIPFLGDKPARADEFMKMSIHTVKFSDWTSKSWPFLVSPSSLSRD